MSLGRAPGSRFGDLTLVERTPGIGTAERYLATTSVGTHVWLEILPEADLEAERIGAVLDRAKLLTRLDHPSLSSVEAYGRAQAAVWASGTLRGTLSLRDALAARTLDQVGLLATLDGVAVALDYLHANQIVLGELSPEMIRVDATGAYLELGFWWLLTKAEEPLLAGNPRYMSPERQRGDSVGPAADVYGLALLACEGLCGTYPFAASNVVAEMYRKLTLDLAPLQLPAPVEIVLRACLAHDPETRLPTPSAVVEQLRGAFQQAG